MNEIPRGPDDDRAEARVFGRLAQTYADRPRNYLGTCPRCGTEEILMIGDLCHACEETRRWSTDNRAMCALVHRDAR